MESDVFIQERNGVRFCSFVRSSTDRSIDQSIKSLSTFPFLYGNEFFFLSLSQKENTKKMMKFSIHSLKVKEEKRTDI